MKWDKVFPLSDEVSHRKVTFVNHFGITLVADLYEPKEYEGKLPAIAVAGPFGAVKEQSSGLYAQEMAKEDSWQLHSILHSQVKAVGIHAISTLRTSMSKIFRLL